MTDATASTPPVTPSEPERDDETPSTEFASALADYEHTQPAADASVAAAAKVAVGSKLKSTVVSVGDEHVLVDFGGRSEGLVETLHFKNEDGTLRVGVGDVLELYVVESGDQVTLAPSIKVKAKDAKGGKPGKPAKAKVDLQPMREAHASQVPVSGKVTAVNSGGLTLDIGGVRGFCPMSQIELGFCSDPSKYIGQSLEFLVTTLEEGRGSVVASRRALLKTKEDVNAQQVIATIQPGDEREGTVVRLEAFGAFVDLGGIDGMVHVSEIRHERVGHPNQALKEGEKVKVRVLRIDQGKDGRPRIALSMKATAADPWSDVEQQYTVGQRVSGTVARLTDFGAFVSLTPGVDGLVHVSEIAYERVAHPKDVLTVGQAVEAIVQSVEPEKKRVSLSIKKTLEVPEGYLAAPERSGGSDRPRSGAGGGAGGPRGGSSAGGPRSGGGGGAGGPRGGGGFGGGAGGRGGPGSRPQREPREPRFEMPKSTVPEGPTTMALALRKAMEAAKLREEGKN